MSRMIRPKLRREEGASTIMLVLVIAFFAVLPLSILGFETSRFFLIQSELQHVLDCAALSGTAALAQPATAATTSAATLVQGNAMNACAANFKSNGVLKVAFNDSNTEINLNSAPDLTNPPFQHATLNVVLANQSGTPQPTGSLTATTMQVSAAYTDAPVFLGSSISPLGGLFTVRAYAIGGLPQLDLVLCFDCSGSMDDSTIVYFVNRHWNGAAKTPQVEYTTVAGGKDIYALTSPPLTGTSLNAAPPQQLSFANYSAGTPYQFSEATTSLKGLRALLVGYTSNPALPEQGCPPGNFVASAPTNALGNGINWNALPGVGFTDMVCVPTGYNVNYAVEASRGNMNSAALLLQSQGGKNISNQLTGYTVSATAYANYWAAVNTTVLPMSIAQTAAVNFFNQMNTSTNVHISLITFAQNASGNPGAQPYTDTSNKPNYNTDGNIVAGTPFTGWAGGGVGSWSLPYVPLAQNSFNLQSVINAVQGVAASGTAPAQAPLNAQNGTDISDALQYAVAELTNPALIRPAAKKAIVLFTDGIPTLPTDQATGTNDAYNQAIAAKAANIPIYTIGLSTNPSITVAEATVLGDNTGGSGPGIAYKSGNNATYTSVTSAINLQNAFQKIARSLVVLQSQK